MSHFLAARLGQITQEESNELAKLKKSNPLEYHRREREDGAQRDQLIEKYGRSAVEEAERDEEKEKRNPHRSFSTVAAEGMAPSSDWRVDPTKRRSHRVIIRTRTEGKGKGRRYPLRK